MVASTLGDNGFRLWVPTNRVPDKTAPDLRTFRRATSRSRFFRSYRAFVTDVTVVVIFVDWLEILAPIQKCSSVMTWISIWIRRHSVDIHTIMIGLRSFPNFRAILTAPDFRQNIALLPDDSLVDVDNANIFSNNPGGTSENPTPTFPSPNDVKYNAVTQ